MSQPYVGEIQIYGFSFAPRDWAFCNGQIFAIQQNTALFSLIGSAYGGDGRTTFALPNLASRQACGAGRGPGLSDYQIGESFGEFSVTLLTSEMPGHNHGMRDYLADPSTLTVAPAATSALGFLAGGAATVFAPAGNPVMMNPLEVQAAGANQPHPNQQPYLGLNYSISLYGTFPAFD